MATTITANGVIMPKPYPPGVYVHYASGQSNILGWLQVGAGCALIITSIIVLATYCSTVVFGDMFVGIFLTATGASGVGAAKYRTTSPIISLLVLSSIASVVAFIAFCVWSVAIDKAKDKYSGTDLDVAIATGYTFIFVYMAEVVIGVWSAVISTSAACCGHRQTSVGIATATITQPYGHQVVMFSQSGQCTSSSVPATSYMQHGCVKHPMAPPPYYSHTAQAPPSWSSDMQQQQQQQQQQSPYGQQQYSSVPPPYNGGYGSLPSY